MATSRKKVSSESRDRLRGITLQSRQFRKKTFAYYPPIYEKTEKDDGTIEYEFKGYEKEPVHIGVRQPTVRERNQMIEQCRDEKGVFNEMKFVLECVINLTYDPESGESLYDRADMDALANQPAGDMVDQMGEEAISMLTLGTPDTGEAKNG